MILLYFLLFFTTINIYPWPSFFGTKKNNADTIPLDENNKNDVQLINDVANLVTVILIKLDLFSRQKLQLSTALEKLSTKANKQLQEDIKRKQTRLKNAQTEYESLIKLFENITTDILTQNNVGQIKWNINTFIGTPEDQLHLYREKTENHVMSFLDKDSLRVMIIEKNLQKQN